MRNVWHTRPKRKETEEGKGKGKIMKVINVPNKRPETPQQKERLEKIKGKLKYEDESESPE